MFWFCRWGREARTLEKEMWFWPTNRRQEGVISQTLLSSHRYRLFLLSLYTYLSFYFNVDLFFFPDSLLGMVSFVKLRWWTMVQFISPILYKRMKTYARSSRFWIEHIKRSRWSVVMAIFGLNWSPLKEELQKTI